ncbi:MAG: hypothetical protein ACKPEQ_28870, partial [Dolichospermum sp.]
GVVGYTATKIADWLLNGRGSSDIGLYMTSIWIALTVVILVSIGYPLHKMTNDFINSLSKR